MMANYPPEDLGTVELYFGEGFTPEEEDREVKRALRFYEIANSLGVPHVTRLKVIRDADDDGNSSRPPYYVQLDNLEWE